MKLSVAMITLNEERILEKTLKSLEGVADEIVIVDSGSTDKTEEIGGVMKLSVAMITLNEERILEKTLKSLEGVADEIVIVDSGSTDKTEEIAKKYGARFINQKWLGYGKQRNVAIENATGDWVLNIDADEEISPKLAKKLKEIKENENEKEVFEINFSSVCFGKKLKHGGWSNQYHIRLFRKDAGRFNTNEVHEEFLTDKKVYRLKEEIYHHSYITLEEYFTKFNRYTTEGAKEYYRRGKIFNRQKSL